MIYVKSKYLYIDEVVGVADANLPLSVTVMPPLVLKPRPPLQKNFRIKNIPNCSKNKYYEKEKNKPSCHNR